MDFLEFLKNSCDDADVKFDIRDNKIYQWQTSIDTGFSLYELNDYFIRVDDRGSSTGYELRPYSSDYKIYKDGTYTSFDLRDSGYGALRLYHGGSLYGQDDSGKERAKRVKVVKTEASSNSSAKSFSSSSAFPGGFWSWSSWLDGLAYALAFTFTIGLILELISPWLILIGPGIMVLWAILLIFHKIRKRRK